MFSKLTHRVQACLRVCVFVWVGEGGCVCACIVLTT